jgi:hypothetical protein
MSHVRSFTGVGGARWSVRVSERVDGLRTARPRSIVGKTADPDPEEWQPATSINAMGDEMAP